MKNLSPKEAITILEGMRIDIPVPKAAVTQRKRNTALDMAISALNCSEIPNNWIPCRERLPENGRQVLVFARSVHFALAKYDEMREADGTYKMQWVTFDAWKPFYKIKDVIAWMPLPEYYQEGEKE